MQQVFHKLLEANVGKVKENEPLSKHTTIKIGGPADILVEPKGVEGLEATMAIVREANCNWRVIGRGSNLLVDDEGIRGVVIKLGRGLKHLEEDGNELRIGAGHPLVPLATIMSKKGFAGFEFAGGIPGSVGGAVYMNAGAHGSDISKILIRARILKADGTLKWYSNEEMQYNYRTSELQKSGGICVEAIFRLQQGDAETIHNEMQEFKDYRHRTQPYDKPCAGSIFRNPLPNHAGQLIEESGLKGYQIGGAKVSDLHANFIVNAGSAKAKDVHDLIHYIQHSIKETYDIDLHTEIEIVQKSWK